MRIALIVTGGLHPSGRHEVIPALLAFLERASPSHDIHAFALHHLPQAQRYGLAGATIHDLGRPQGRWRQFRLLMQALQANGPFDIIHGYMAVPAGALAVLAARRLRARSVVSCDSGEYVALPDYQYGLQRTLRHRLVVSHACTRASGVHVTSEFMKGLARTQGVGATCIPLGIQLERFAIGDPRAEGPPWRLLQVASLNRIKDQPMLLRALALLRASHDVHLDLVGEDTLSGQLQRDATALGLGDAVTFHGFVPQDQLAPLHHRAHLYVQSSRHEAAGVAVLEAAAAGLPIVGTSVGYVSDWSGTAALTVRPGDPQALAAAIAVLLADPVKRGTLAAAAGDRVRAYDAAHTTAAMIAFYESLLIA
jgi:glycosyltransferase involved in cell wall biosynthesis